MPTRYRKNRGQISPALYLICALAGYGGSVTTQAISFVTERFHESQSSQSFALAVIRLDWILAVPLARQLDRRNHESVMQLFVLGTVLSSLTVGSSQNFIFYVIAQTIARAFCTALATVAAIQIAELSPKERRGATSSIAVVCAGLGSGIALAPLAFADSGTEAWRAFYVLPIVALPLCLFTVSKRAEMGVLPQADEPSGLTTETPVADRRRYGAIAVAIGLSMVFINPSTQLLNEYLRDSHQMTAGRIAGYLLVTNVFGALVLVLARNQADRVGRRRVVMIGVVGYVVFQAAVYTSHGSTIWVLGAAASAAASLALPVIPVLPSELSAPGTRGARSGTMLAASRVGGLIGLLAVAGMLHTNSLGSSVAILAIPGALGGALFYRLPKTHRLTLRRTR